LPLSASQMRAVLYQDRPSHPIEEKRKGREKKKERKGRKDRDFFLAALRIPYARFVVVRRLHHPLAVAADSARFHGVGMAISGRRFSLPRVRNPIPRERGGWKKKKEKKKLAVPLMPRYTRAPYGLSSPCISLPLSASQMLCGVCPKTPYHPLAVAADAALFTGRGKGPGKKGEREKGPCRSAIPDARVVFFRRRHHPLAFAAERRATQAVWPFTNQ